jgi:hypothetical protein
MRMRDIAPFRLVVLFCASLAVAITANAQQARDQNTRALKQYLAPRQVTTLEWELLQFNLTWNGSYDGRSNYVGSHPLYFDRESMRFRTVFTVQEKRESNDLEPWFQLPRARRESIMQGAIDVLLLLLMEYFPEVKSRPALVYAEFWLHPNGDRGRSTLAKFENGTLLVTE